MRITYRNHSVKDCWISSWDNIPSDQPIDNNQVYPFKHKRFDENIARKEGYKLSWFGQPFQNFLMKFFPDQFCNIYILIAHKNK
jgi:hypothetical protein